MKHGVLIWFENANNTNNYIIYAHNVGQIWIGFPSLFDREQLKKETTDISVVLYTRCLIHIISIWTENKIF
jgi:hypothetical protein